MADVTPVASGDVAPVPLGRIALTQRQMRATEIMLYRAADLIDRLMADGVPYTKIAVPQAPAPTPVPGVPNPAPPGKLPPIPVPHAPPTMSSFPIPPPEGS